MKTTMKKAMTAVLTGMALTAAIGSTTNVFAMSDSYKIYEDEREVTVADGGAYLYDDPDSMDVLKYLEPGTALMISGDVVEGGVETGWYAVQTEDFDLAYILAGDFVDYSYNSNTTSIATVEVSKGYLALRTEAAYDESNEIGELYTGDTVEVEYFTDNGYVYVYSYTYGTYGFVNANYLIYQ